MSEGDKLQLVDSHIHLWDLSSHDWYPAMQGADASKPFASLGDVTRMARDFTVSEFREETEAAEVVGVVHVTAVSAPRVHVDEARWLDGVLDQLGLPAATIGALEAEQSRAEMEADLDAQGESSRFRGARVLTGVDPESEAAERICALLDERGLVFDVVAKPAAMPGYARLLERFPRLGVVLEHAGWPEGTDEVSRRRWLEGMRELAARPNVVCKVSGIGMVTHSLAEEAQRPWIEGCFETFGPGRCLFGGNFPVDAMYGGYGELLVAVHAVADELPEAERQAFFVDNARRAYAF